MKFIFTLSVASLFIAVLSACAKDMNINRTPILSFEKIEEINRVASIKQTEIERSKETLAKIESESLAKIKSKISLGVGQDKIQEALGIPIVKLNGGREDYVNLMMQNKMHLDFDTTSFDLTEVYKIQYSDLIMTNFKIHISPDSLIYYTEYSKLSHLIFVSYTNGKSSEIKFVQFNEPHWE